MNSRILFIGNFLSEIHGTIGPTELMAERYQREGRQVIKASNRLNKILRLYDMVLKTLFYKYDKILIDVYSSSAIFFALTTSWVAKQRDKEIILVLHGGGLKQEYPHKRHKIDRLLKRAKHIVTPSHFLQDFFCLKGYHIEYIPNTIDLSRFSYQQKKNFTHKILWVRAFTDNYNPDIAIKTFAEVLKSVPDATLTMVGPDKGNLIQTKSLIKELNLDDKITITGKIANNELPILYHSHDIYLNTTSYESFGVALLEAAACGLPIVSTSVGEIPLIWMDGVNMLLTKDKDVSSLAHNIVRLIKNHTLYNSIRENAYKKSREFSWGEISEKWNIILPK